MNTKEIVVRLKRLEDIVAALVVAVGESKVKKALDELESRDSEKPDSSSD